MQSQDLGNLRLDAVTACSYVLLTASLRDVLAQRRRRGVTVAAVPVMGELGEWLT